MQDQPNDKTGKDGKDATAGADAIRDDPAEFGQSSEYVQTGTTGRYAGGGPEESAAMAGRDGKGNNAGSQDWQHPQSAAPADHESTKTADDPMNAEVTSRSADPGQSSYGGFEGEGTSPNNESDEKSD